eukprot:5593099-Amphidinium_carterae.1
MAEMLVWETKPEKAVDVHHVVFGALGLALGRQALDVSSRSSRRIACKRRVSHAGLGVAIRTRAHKDVSESSPGGSCQKL